MHSDLWRDPGWKFPYTNDYFGHNCKEAVLILCRGFGAGNALEINSCSALRSGGLCGLFHFQHLFPLFEY
jgi:hypothetical protein